MSPILSQSQSFLSTIPINCIRKLYEEVGAGDIHFDYEAPKDNKPAKVTIYIDAFKAEAI